MRPRFKRFWLNPTVVTFLPDELANFALWLEGPYETWQDNAFSVDAVLTNDPLGGWKDRSTSLRHATQATAANKPSLLAADKNGLDTVRFDGVDDRLVLASSIALTGDCTIYIVSKSRSVASTNVTYFGGVTTPFVRQNNSTTLQIRNDASTLLGITHGALVTDQWGILVATRSGSSWTRHYNGVADGTGTLAGTITLDRMGCFASTGFINNDFAAALIYTSAHSDLDRGKVTDYLNSRYAIY